MALTDRTPAESLWQPAFLEPRCVRPPEPGRVTHLRHVTCRLSSGRPRQKRNTAVRYLQFGGRCTRCTWS